jgi:hypothetical protein
MNYKNKHIIQIKDLGGPQWSIALSEVYANTKNDIVLLGHLKRFGGKMGEFDNSVRKLQHQGNKTCCKIFFP